MVCWNRLLQSAVPKNIFCIGFSRNQLVHLPSIKDHPAFQSLWDSWTRQYLHCANRYLPWFYLQRTGFILQSHLKRKARKKKGAKIIFNTVQFTIKSLKENAGSPTAPSARFTLNSGLFNHTPLRSAGFNCLRFRTLNEDNFFSFSFYPQCRWAKCNYEVRPPNCFTDDSERTWICSRKTRRKK